MIQEVSKPAYLTEIQAASLVSELEQSNGLFDIKLEGYSAWRIVRSKVLNKLQQYPFVDRRPSYLKVEWLFERLLLFIPDIFSILSARQAKFFVKTFSSALNDQVNGHYKDVYFDDVMIMTGGCFKVETLNNLSYSSRRKKALIPAALTTAAIDLIAAFCMLVFPSTACSKAATQIIRILHKEPILVKINIGDIKLTLKRFYWLKRIYTYLLRKVSPSHVLVADSGEFALLAASQECKIRSVEFQHGVFIREHPDALPKLKISDRSSLLIPDKLFLFGKYWKDQLLESAFLEDELRVVGNPRIDNFRKIRAGFEPSLHGSPTKILVTTQGVDRERLIDFLSGFTRAADGVIKYTLTIKLHPISDRDKSPYLRAFKAYPTVQIFLGSEQPSTFDLLARADIHASIASAVHYDALGLGVPTIIIPLAGHEIIQPLVDAGHAKISHTPEEMLKLVQDLKHISITSDISDYYFAPNSIEAICEELGISNRSP
jgi:hypothetical protein